MTDHIDPIRAIGRTHAESTSWFDRHPTPPEGSPNMVFVVQDDVGYSDLGCFGSDIGTPHFDGLAERGLRYSNFHTTTLCAPTRACLLTGRNHHAVGMRYLANIDMGRPDLQEDRQAARNDTSRPGRKSGRQPRDRGRDRNWS